MKNFFSFAVMTLFSFLCFNQVMAAGYPDRPIQLYLGFGAGGALDTMARIFAEEMSVVLGKPVIVQNKEGGGGNLATTYLKNEKADGYTISLIPSQSLTYNPVAMKTQFTADDFSYLGSGVYMQEAFVCLPDKPYKTFKEMIEWAKQNNQKLKYSSVVPIDIAITKAITKATGVQLLPVPTKGGAASMTSVLGGHVDFGFSGGVHYEYVKAERMIVLASLGAKRLAAFPNVPTIVESGYDIPIDNYYVLFLRKETPPEVMDVLAKAAQKAFTSEKFVGLVDKMNLKGEYLTPEQSTAEITKAQKIMEQLQAISN